MKKDLKITRLIEYLDKLHKEKPKTRREWYKKIRNDVDKELINFPCYKESTVEMIINTLESDGYIKH